MAPGGINHYQPFINGDKIRVKQYEGETIVCFTIRG